MLSNEPILESATRGSDSKFSPQLTPEQFKELEELQSQYFSAIDKSLEQVKQGLGKETLKRSLRAYLASIYANGEMLQTEEENQEPASTKRKDKRTTMVKEGETSIPATPKFNPDLPETPAVLRRAARLRGKGAESSIIKKQSEIRITRSTIRQSNVKRSVSKDESVNDQISTGVISFELPNGSHVDLDMSAGPEQALHNLSKQGVSVFEMKSKVNEYVNQVRNFFKSLSGYNRGK